jgi:hypothetical protein
MAHDNIWFTYKARICTHDRLARNDFHTQNLLVWYAFCGAVLAIVTVRFPTILGGNTDIVAAVLSTALLVVSMMVTGRDFRGRSIEMRRNYLSLQTLYRKGTSNPPTLTDAQIESEYEQLLDSAENHSHLDDMRARVFNTGKLDSRLPTTRETAIAYGYCALRFLVLSTAYLLPLFAVAYMALIEIKSK